MRRDRNSPWILGFNVIAAVAALSVMITLRPLTAAAFPGLSAADVAAVDDGGGVAAGPNGSGTAERRDNIDEPSEDGTDSEPDTARPGVQEPESAEPDPPGCKLRGGPLELLV